jgi:hypothetical protein
MTEQRYIYLQKTNIRVPLSTDERGCVIITDGKSITISRPVERMWVYWLYGGAGCNGEFYITAWLQDKYKWITEVKASRIIREFKESHPDETVETPGPGLSDFEWTGHFHPKGYVLPLPFHNPGLTGYFRITKTREKELVKIILKSNGNPIKEITGWYNKLKRDSYEVWSRKDIKALANSTAIQYGLPLDEYGYGIKPVEESATGEDEELAMSFLNQHGLDELSLSAPAPKKAKEKRSIDPVLFFCAILGGFLFWSNILLNGPLSGGMAACAFSITLSIIFGWALYTARDAYHSKARANILNLSLFFIIFGIGAVILCAVVLALCIPVFAAVQH